MKMEQHKTKKILSVIALVFGFFFLGLYIGFSDNLKTNKVMAFLNTKDATIKEDVDFSAFWKVWNTIDKKYPGANTITDQSRMNGAIAGLVDSLEDPYSVFFDKEESKSFKEEISGSFSGVGMEVGIKDKILTVIAPLKGTPADNAGMLPGDKILKIDDKVTINLSVDQAVKLIRGEKGTTVKLSIHRDGDKEPREISIVRDTIAVPTLETEKRADGIFVIKLYTFSSNSRVLFQKAMSEFLLSKSDKLVIDLRGNPGGYLDIAVEMTSYFLPKGKIIVTEDYGDAQKPNILRSVGYNTFGDNLKMVILLDGGSASASEIMAGALQDYDKAKIVGTQSFGKGSVQEVVNVGKDTLLKITVAKWLTPNGNSISEKGLIPDYTVEYLAKDKTAKKDPQMDKAIELLKNWK